VETATEVVLTVLGLGILVLRVMRDRAYDRRLQAIARCPSRCKPHSHVRVVIDLDTERERRRSA
jgi:hypothetical protein